MHADKLSINITTNPSHSPTPIYYPNYRLEDLSDGGRDFRCTACSSVHNRLRVSPFEPTVVLGARDGLRPRSLYVGRGRVGLSSRPRRDRGGLGRLDSAVRVRGLEIGLVSRVRGRRPTDLSGERGRETGGLGGEVLFFRVETILRGGRAGGDDARDEDELELASGFERTRV